MSYTAEKSVSLIKEGNYECIIEKMELKPAKDNTRTLSIVYKIRDDIEQESKGRLVFENIWLESQYQKKKIENLLFAVNAPKGQVFSSIEEVVGYCEGRKLIVNVGISFDDYYQEDKNKVKYVKPSANPDKVLGEQKQELNVPVSDDDLPF